jgi:ABC-type Zn uptake system ZnuABC Zn-binding protein ZnuA
VCCSLALGATALGNLTVVTSTEDLSSIVKSIGGDKVSVSAIVTGARDPHSIEAKPSYMSRLMKANLFVSIGLALEIAWEDAIIKGSRNNNLKPGAQGHLYASTGITPLEKATGSVSRAQGDIHPYGNPHIWLDPANARKMAESIADRMGVLDPANKALYEKNLGAFQRRIDDAMFGSAAVGSIGSAKLWQWSSAGNLTAQVKAAGQNLGGWAAKMEPFRGRAVVTYHKSWSYFADRFDLRVVAQLEPKPGIPPTPGHLSNVIKLATSNNVKAILVEPFYSKNAAQTVAGRTGAKVVSIPLTVGSDAAAKDYISLIDTIVTRVSAAIGG